MSEVKRVLVAMSGGVDSSVAAALLREAGHDLVGVTLHLWDADGEHYWEPETEEDWIAVRASAMTLIESGNLLMMGDRPRDQVVQREIEAHTRRDTIRGRAAEERRAKAMVGQHCDLALDGGLGPAAGRGGAEDRLLIEHRIAGGFIRVR